MQTRKLVTCSGRGVSFAAVVVVVASDRLVYRRSAFARRLEYM